MIIALIKDVTYYAETGIKKHQGKVISFYPIIKFIKYGCKKGIQTKCIDSQQSTRSKALTIAKQHILNIKNC